MKRVLSLLVSTMLFLGVISTSLPALGSEVKWSSVITSDEWVLVTNEGGAELGYHPDSGVKIIVEDEFAFKDMNRNGKLDAYEDWRLDAQTRVANLIGSLSLEQIAALMISNVVAPTDGTLAERIQWANDLQASTESNDPFGIPKNVIGFAVTDTSDRPDSLALASTFDADIAAERADSLSKELRALGIHTYLGPTADLATEPRWYTVSDTFGEDPALSRDMVKAVVNAMQSTYGDEGNDMGWGSQSVGTVLKHWPGAGPSESGRAASRWWGAFNVYPGKQFETHLIPFIDGGLGLDGKTQMPAGVMSAYSIVWDENGENLAASFNYEQNKLLRDYGFDGVIYADWDVSGELGHGSNVQYFAPHERILLAILAGTDAFVDFSGKASIEYINEAVALAIDLIEGNYEEPTGEIVVAGGEDIKVEYSETNANSEATATNAEMRVIINPLETLLPVLNLAFDINEGMNGEETIRTRLEESAHRVLINSMRLGLFENPYVDSASSVEKLANTETNDDALKSIIMLKNDGVISENWAGSKPKVYVPMSLYNESGANTDGEPEWKAGTRVPLEELAEYFDVITDTVADSSSSVTIDDITRASADEIASADFVLVFMESPMNALDDQNSGVALDAWYPETAPWDYHFINTGHIQYFPISMQYRTYRAINDNVRQPSIAGRSIWWFLAGVYGDNASHENESRAYFGQRTSSLNKHELDSLLDIVDIVPENVPVIVAMNADRGYVFSEYEEDVDAILMGFDVDYRSFLPIVLGTVEPSGLLPIQMPLDMEAVEGQYEDVPRDMQVYTDSMGNAYDFSFGLNWSGKINDERTEKYNVPALETLERQLSR